MFKASPTGPTGRRAVRTERGHMKIGIIGSGNIGRTAAQHFVDADHEVMVSNSRSPESLSSLVADLGSGAEAGTPDEAVEFGDIVLLAIPWRAREELPDAELFADTIVVDAMNPYGENFEVLDLGDDTSSGLLAEQLPEARVVKAFNTMYWETMRDEKRVDAPLDERLVLFVASDDEDVKATVSELVEDIGFVAVDTGSLVEGGRKQEPGSVVYNDPMTRAEAQDRLR
jgi:predicted dinucleotide-binding enzyme